MNIATYYRSCALELLARGERLTASLINNLYRFGIDPVVLERTYIKEQAANG